MFTILKKAFNLIANIRSTTIKTKTKDMKHYILKTPINDPINTNQEEVIFGCGCFWGAEKGFWKLPGVISTAVGYAGGDKENPNYREVCSGITGHTEVVRVVWDPTSINFCDLLKLFWECHNPTQGNRQGNDIGSQYRSAIYIYKENHLQLAKASKKVYEEKLIENGFENITTEIKMNINFHIAEDYHQQYLAKPGSRPYCSAMPTKIELPNFTGSSFKHGEEVWSKYNWETKHCILRSDNQPITIT